MKAITKVTLVVALILSGASLYSQKKVQNFTVSRVIPAAAEKVWQVVGEDFGAIANSHPKIVSSSYINGSLQAGEGAERVCNFNEKGTKFTHEKMVDYDPETYTFKALVYNAEGLYMDTNYSYAVYSVEALDVNSCRLTVDMHFRTKPAFMGSLAKGKFKKTIADYALAVEHHVRTGEAVTKDNFKAVKKQYKL